jgi:hypothetical protein
MGFDLHGISPQTDTPEPTWKGKDPIIKIGENNYEIDPQIKEEYDDFIKSKCEWNESTRGAYFRNNVWWWRPLWNFVAVMCDDILTEKDIEAGAYNDGHKISETKAVKIAKRLFNIIEEDKVKEYEELYKQHLDKLNKKDWNKNYPFSEDNVRQFANFCANSGGFRIC